MVVRQARLTAWLLLATIAALALWSLLRFGPDHALPVGRPGSPPMPMWKASLFFPGTALFWTLIYDGSSRLPRWRHNIERAGNVFATTWISTVTLVLAIQVISLANALGYRVDRGTAFAGVVGILLLFRANLLPKSRPAWFNGIALPVFASRDDVWRRVHRASALRLAAIGVIALGLAAFAPTGVDPVRPLVLLMLAELVVASLHGLWLGLTTTPPELASR